MTSLHRPSLHLSPEEDVVFLDMFYFFLLSISRCPPDTHFLRVWRDQSFLPSYLHPTLLILAIRPSIVSSKPLVSSVLRICVPYLFFERTIFTSYPYDKSFAPQGVGSHLTLFGASFLLWGYSLFLSLALLLSRSTPCNLPLARVFPFCVLRDAKVTVPFFRRSLSTCFPRLRNYNWRHRFVRNGGLLFLRSRIFSPSPHM